MRRAIYPGSFDPVTNGHLDVIERAVKLFDEVIVAVAVNSQKQALFTFEERLALLEQTTRAYADRLRVVSLDGLLVDYARREGATAIVRGLRAVSDFEFEFQMALMNRKLEGSVETIFLMPKEDYTYLEFAHHQGNRPARWRGGRFRATVRVHRVAGKISRFRARNRPCHEDPPATDSR